jgi:hypothetical protein
MFRIWTKCCAGALLLASVSSGLQATPMLGIAGIDSVTQGDAGLQYTVNLSSVAPSSIGDATAVVTFDTAALSFGNVFAPGTLVSLGNVNPLFDDTFNVGFDASAGTVTITLQKSPLSLGITGDGSLAIIGFNVLGDAPPGATELGFDAASSTMFDFITLGPIAFAVASPPFAVNIRPAAEAPVPAPLLLLVCGLPLLRRGVR